MIEMELRKWGVGSGRHLLAYINSSGVGRKLSEYIYMSPTFTPFPCINHPLAPFRSETGARPDE